MIRVLWLLLAQCLVGSAALFAQSALREATPLAVAAWRLGLASVFFVVWSAVAAPTPREHRLPGFIWPRLLLAGVCLALHFLFWFASLQHISVARSTLLVCTTPLWATLGNVALGRRRFTVSFWLALALAGVGVALVVQTGGGPPSHSALAGDVLATLGGAMFAIYLLAVEGLHTALPARQQVTVTYTAAALILWAALLAGGRGIGGYSPGTWAALAGMALGPQVLGHTLMNWSLRHFPSSTVAFSTLLEPVIAAGLAWPLLHQPLTAAQGIGGLLVLLGLAVVLAPPKAARVV